jgi:hypothetical protein
VLHRRRRAHSSWRISSPDRAPIAVHSGREPPARVDDAGVGRVVAVSGRAPTQRLTSDEEMALMSRPPELLAFACWLIAKWETMPAVPGGGG